MKKAEEQNEENEFPQNEVATGEASGSIRGGVFCIIESIEGVEG